MLHFARDMATNTACVIAKDVVRAECFNHVLGHLLDVEGVPLANVAEIWSHALQVC
jgi:hypothetical protein